jgi:hypothetical protein
MSGTCVAVILSGLDDNFLLERTRLYMDVDTGDFFRFYVEAIDALSHWENETPRTIEENRFDALNLFRRRVAVGDRRGGVVGSRGAAGVALWGSASDFAARLGQHASHV